jgi:putative flippase GtrA
MTLLMMKDRLRFHWLDYRFHRRTLTSINPGAELRARLLRLAQDQRIRFLIVGGVNTVVGYGLFAAFNEWVFANVPFGYLASLVLSYAIAIVLAFVLYRRFVFVVRGNLVIDFLRFVSVYLLSIGINLVVLPIFVELLHLPALLAQAIILVVTTVISFVGHRYFSFRRSRIDPVLESDEPERTTDVTHTDR